MTAVSATTGRRSSTRPVSATVLTASGRIAPRLLETQNMDPDRQQWELAMALQEVGLMGDLLRAATLLRAKGWTRL